MILHELRRATPESLHRWAGRAASPLGWTAAALIAAALVVGLGIAGSPDGNAHRIAFLHHPAAWLSLTVYYVIGVLSLATLADHNRATALLAAALAPTGALFTGLALWTGSLWRRPLGGAWWTWDAEGTSQLLLLFLYAGFIGLRAMIDAPRRADRAGALLALLGAANLPVIYFSLHWWEATQHAAPASTVPAMPMELVAASILAGAGFAAYAASAALRRARCLVAEREALARAMRLQADAA